MRTCLVLLIVTAIISSCASLESNGGQNSPLTPDFLDTVRSEEFYDVSSQLWGLWQFEADPDACTLEFVPLRTGTMHLNALPLMEPPAGVNLSISNLSFNGLVCDVDVTLTHPFAGLSQCMGFDVCGILIGSGTNSDFSDPDIVMPGKSETRLLNADGYTRWWNPVEFSAPGPGIFRYRDGLLGMKHAACNFTNTLNGYKLFTDELGPDDNVLSLGPTDLNVFSDGAANTRHYTIDFSGGLKFNYAVDANWINPVGEVPFEPDDYPVQALRCEAWAADVHVMNNTLWSDGVDCGGDLSMSITVFDHYNAYSDTLRIESPGHFPPAEGVYSGSSGDGYKTFDVEITDATPSPESIELLVVVESEVDGYGGVIPDAAISGYFLHSVIVSPGSSTGDKYVDGDYTGGDSDGSQSKPYTTVQSGMGAVMSGYTVHVDYLDSGDNTYNTDGLILKSGVTFIGDNWSSGGPGKPKLKTGSGAFTIDSVADLTDFTLEGFEIGFGQDDFACGGVIFRGDINSNIIVRHNHFTGTLDDTGKGGEFHFNALKLGDSGSSLVAYNEFGPIDFIGEPDAPAIADNTIMFVSRCNGVTIKNNFIHDIAVTYTGDTVQPGVVVNGIFLSTCNLGYLNNNLICQITGNTCFEMGITGICANNDEWEDMPHYIYNNTIDSLSYTNSTGYPPMYGVKLWLDEKGGESYIKNTITTSLSPPAGVSVQGYYSDESDLYEITFSSGYNLGEATNYFFDLIVGDGAVDYPGIDPQYVNNSTSPYDYHFQSGSGCEMGDPNFIDWDDTGAPSGDPGETDINNRSRMGCFGGPDGDWDPYNL